MIDDVTVLVPLHRSERFFDVVDENLGHLAPTCRVLVSDPTEYDDTLDRLARRWSHQPTVEFIGRRDLPSGWVPHYNDLHARCHTEFFLWLAHDDSIEADFVIRCRDALLTRPDVVGAFGRLVPVEGAGLEAVEVPTWAAPTVGGSPDEAVSAVTAWSPTVGFRSVFRRDATDPLAVTPADGRWADVVWTFSLLTSERLLAVPEATYHKRWYPESTHRQWPNADHKPLLTPLLVAELVRKFPEVDVSNEVGQLIRWVEDDLRVQQVHVATDRESLRAALTQTVHERDNARAAIDALRSSRSWKLGQSVARLAHRLRLGRR